MQYQTPLNDVIIPAKTDEGDLIYTIDLQEAVKCPNCHADIQAEDFSDEGVRLSYWAVYKVQLCEDHQYVDQNTGSTVAQYADEEEQTYPPEELTFSLCQDLIIMAALCRGGQLSSGDYKFLSRFAGLLAFEIYDLRNNGDVAQAG